MKYIMHIIGKSNFQQLPTVDNSDINVRIHSSKNKLLRYVQGNFCILYYFNFNCFTNINISAKNIYLSTYIVLATVSK